MSISTHYGKLNGLWEELCVLEPLINCACCVKCTAANLHNQRRETYKLHEFFMGPYPQFYAHLRSNIVSSDSLPTLDLAYHLAI